MNDNLAWPEQVDIPQARSILMEFVAGCDSRDLGNLYAAAARKPIALVWEGREYLCFTPEGQSLARLEREKRERAALPDLIVACKLFLEFASGVEDETQLLCGPCSLSCKCCDELPQCEKCVTCAIKYAVARVEGRVDIDES